jgi:hypothetical protein
MNTSLCVRKALLLINKYVYNEGQGKINEKYS